MPVLMTGPLQLSLSVLSGGGALCIFTTVYQGKVEGELCCALLRKAFLL